jgi:hypothetical protein
MPSRVADRRPTCCTKRNKWGTRATKVGYKKLEIDDPQIVNGLQTSRQIDAYYRSGTFLQPDQDMRRIMVRVLQSSDEGVRDDVIRATNSQNKMPSEALRATDRIHGQIETLFRQYDLFYDRRKGQYKDEGKPIAKIVPVIELLQAALAIALKRPDAARARPRDYIKEDDKYAEVFGENNDVTLYLQCVLLYRRVEAYLASEKLNLVYGHQRNLKFYVAMYVAAAYMKHAYIPPDKLLSLDLSKLDESLIANCCERVTTIYQRQATKVAGDYDLVAKGPHLLQAMNADLRRRFNARKKKSVVRAVGR